MKKQIIGIVLGIFLVSLASAIYAGDTYEHNFSSPIVNCSILNNTYNLEGLNLSWNDSIAKIETDIGYKEDNFTLSCLINESVYTEEVIINSHSGGHSKKKVVQNNTTNLTEEFVVEEWNYVPTLDTPKEEVNQTTDIPKVEEKKGISTNLKILIIGLVIILFGVITFILESKRR